MRWLLIFLVLWTVFWYAFTHRVPRFYLPMAGAAAVLAARGIAFLGTGWKRIALVVMLLVALGWQVRVDVLQLSSAAPAYDIVGDADRFFRATRDPFFPVIVFAREHPPPDRLMLVGEAQTLHLPPNVLASTVFNREVFTTTVGDVSDPETVRARLAEAGVTHLFVNWAEIGRLRKTYTWTDRKGRTHPGFPPLTPADFNRLERAGVLTELPEWCYGLLRKRGLVPGLILEELKQLPGGRLCVFYRVN